MTENEIYCYINGFLKWIISIETSYIVGNKQFFGKISILNLKNYRKSMIEMRRLKNVVSFIQKKLSFVLSRKIINIYNDIAWADGNVPVKYFRKYDKLQYKKNKLKLDIDFLNNCKQLGVYPKFLIFKLPNVSNKDAL